MPETKKEPAAAATATSSKKNISKNNNTTKAAKSQPSVEWQGRKIFEGPANDMEREVWEYLLPRMTAELADRIADKKLTLKGCIDSCFSKGKKFEIRSGNHGFAPITAEQHWKWVREYFGVKDEPSRQAPQITVSRTSDFDSLFDF